MLKKVIKSIKDGTFFKKVNKAVKCGEAETKKLPNRTGLGVLVVGVAL